MIKGARGGGAYRALAGALFRRDRSRVLLGALLRELALLGELALGSLDLGFLCRRGSRNSPQLSLWLPPFSGLGSKQANFVAQSQFRFFQFPFLQ
jgi:hypothetical protein